MLLIAINSSSVLICGVGRCSTFHQKCIKLKTCSVSYQRHLWQSWGHTQTGGICYTLNRALCAPPFSSQGTGVGCWGKKISFNLTVPLIPFQLHWGCWNTFILPVGNVRRTRLLSDFYAGSKYLEAERRVCMPFSFLLLIMSRTRHRLVPALCSNLKSI